MKPTLPFISVLFALTFLGIPAGHCVDDNSINQIASSTADKSSSLIEAEASFDNKKILITVQTESDPVPTSVRFFIDTDSSSSTGYRPAWHKGGDEGANFMVEEGTLFKWAGGNSQQAWNWAPVDDVGPVSVDTPGLHQVGISVPLAALNLKEGDTVYIFAVTGGAEGDKPLDSIPRKNSWSVTIPVGAINQAVP